MKEKESSNLSYIIIDRKKIRERKGKVGTSPTLTLPLSPTLLSTLSQTT